MRKSYIGCEVLGVNSTPRVSFGGGGMGESSLETGEFL